MRLKTDVRRPLAMKHFQVLQAREGKEDPAGRDARSRCLASFGGPSRSGRSEIGKKRWNLPFASLDWWLRQTSRGAKSATGSAREGYSRCRAYVRGEGKKMGTRSVCAGCAAGPVYPPSKTAATRSPFRLSSFSPRFLLPPLSFFLSFSIYA